MAATIVFGFVVSQVYSLGFGIATLKTLKQNAKNFLKNFEIAHPVYCFTNSPDINPYSVHHVPSFVCNVQYAEDKKRGKSTYQYRHIVDVFLRYQQFTFNRLFCGTLQKFYMQNDDFLYS
uniref:Uncharacterized protein n=1 Tax=Ditylenchus dipsaci TaxID=166011 RepID=A0A915DWC6_9BILA